jgi:hypothetical protein
MTPENIQLACQYAIAALMVILLAGILVKLFRGRYL